MQHCYNIEFIVLFNFHNRQIGNEKQKLCSYVVIYINDLFRAYRVFFLCIHSELSPTNTFSQDTIFSYFQWMENGNTTPGSIVVTTLWQIYLPTRLTLQTNHMSHLSLTANFCHVNQVYALFWTISCFWYRMQVYLTGQPPFPYLGINPSIHMVSIAFSTNFWKYSVFCEVQ